jgi:D-alanine-D-alanine ligase-like ATP-grasp enzyme
VLRRKTGAGGSTARARTAFYDECWRDAAAAVGATIRPIGGGFQEIARGGRKLRVFEQFSPLDTHTTLAVAGNKPVVYGLLADAGLPVPRHVEYTTRDLGPARRFLAEAPGPCVVKPARNTGGGTGVTTGIISTAQLVRATVAAAGFSPTLLVEEQVAGDNFRLLYLDGRFLDAIVRRPPHVTGDGRSSVRDLVKAANADRAREGAGIGQTLLDRDLDLRRTLAGQGLRPSSVPAPGQRVVLKTVINQNSGADNLAAAHRLCAEVIDAGARAAAAVGVRLAGVDVITPDPGVPLATSGGAIGEVNTTPGFYYHYRRSGEPFRVAEHILRHVLDDPACGAAATPLVAVGAGRNGSHPESAESTPAEDLRALQPPNVR